MTVKQLAKQIEDGVNWVKEQDTGVVHIDLGNKLAVCIGWLPGYDKEDPTCIHSVNDPEWCINVGIKVNTNKYKDSEYGYWNAPYLDTGIVLDTDVSVDPDEDYKELAQYLLDEYKVMSRYKMDDDGLVLHPQRKR